MLLLLLLLLLLLQRLLLLVIHPGSVMQILPDTKPRVRA